MKEIKNLNLDLNFQRSKQMETYAEAEKMQDALHKVMEARKNSTGVYTSQLHKLSNGNYVIDVLNCTNEYEDKNNKCSQETFVQILAGISEAIPQT